MRKVVRPGRLATVSSPWCASIIFTGTTIRTSIKTAERAFLCFAEEYERAGRTHVPLDKLRECFRPLGLFESRGALYEGAAKWAPAVHEAMKRGLQDRELRRHLFLTTELPKGLSITKLSFVLELLGQNVCCLDGRILGRMFGTKGALKIGHEFNRPVSERVVARYEQIEDAFLSNNPFYRKGDPIGRARAQWMSWETAGRPPGAASHSVWLRVVQDRS